MSFLSSIDVSPYQMTATLSIYAPFVSVIVPYYQKHGNQLKNTLWSLTHQDYFNYEVIVVNDGAEEDLDGDFKYIRLRPFGAPRRSCSIALWAGYEEARGDFIIVSLDDIIAPPNAISLMVQHAQIPHRLVAVVYGLPKDAETLVKWKSDIHAFKRLPNFGAVIVPSNTETNMNAKNVKHHIYFSGQTRKWWDDFGFFPKVEAPETEPLLHQREIKSGVLPYQIEDLEVYHQWHTRGEQFSTRIERIMYGGDGNKMSS